MNKKNYFIQNCTESLNHYLKQIENYHALTREEERELGRRIVSGDTTARDELIEANLLFVLQCALKMRTPYVPIEELITAGNYGLTIAATRFDPSYDNRFSSYAVHYIYNSIREAIREWTCQVSTSDPFQGLQACLPLDERHDEDEENWSRDLIDRIPAPPMSSDEHRLAEEAQEQLHSFLNKWYDPNDAQLLMDWAQMTNDGYTLSDFAFEKRIPLKQMKNYITQLEEKAKIYMLREKYLDHAA